MGDVTAQPHQAQQWIEFFLEVILIISKSWSSSGKEFGFNEKESVAIMGAHTLGRASGTTEGFWKEDGVAAARLNYSLLANKSLV